MGEFKKATCILCEASCGLSVEVEGPEIRSIRGDQDDPFSRGHICPKALAIPDVMLDPDRVREPMKRTRDGFAPVPWDIALGEAAAKIAEVQRRYGRSAVAVYLGNPVVHSFSGILSVPFFAQALGTRARFSATSVDQLSPMLAALQMFGHQFLFTVPDIDHTQYFLMIGANPVASNGSLMTAPGVEERLKALKARGGRLVALDPRRTETAKMADEHLFIRPGGDAFLLLGILHTLFDEGLTRPGRIAEFADGMETLAEIARRFPPEQVAGRAGVEAATIRRLARELAGAERAVCYGRIGTNTQEFGGLCAWLFNAINAVTGNLDRPGGALFARPAADLIALANLTGDRGHYGVWRSRVRGLPEFGGELPVATLSEEIETPGEGQIRALITFAGNPVLSTPNGGRLERALSQLDVMVSVDIYQNETTRHAHYILPTSFGFERDHYDLIFYLLSVRNVTRYAQPLVAPPPGVRGDFEVMMDLALRIYEAGGGRRSLKTPLQLRAVRAMGPQRILDFMLRTGPWPGLSLRKLAANPSGLDLGPLTSSLPERLQTPNRRIQLAPAIYLADLDRLSASEPAEGLLLIGRRHLRSNNSWLHNSARLIKGKNLCTLLINPVDAEKRGLVAGEKVQVRSRVGQVEVPLEVSEDIAPGVVSLPHGWGHSRQGARLQVAGAQPGASVNDLTDEGFVDVLSGTAALSGVPVEVARAV